jgi:hypothetical protein
MAYEFGNKDLAQIYAAIVALGTNNTFNSQSVVKIFTITPAVLNALADDSDTFTIEVENAIPAGSYFTKAFSHTKIALVSDTEIELVINHILAKDLPADQKPVNDEGVIQEFDPATAIAAETTNNINVVNDIEITITMSEMNAQDWLTGEIEIYAVLTEFPDPDDLP